MCTHARQHSTRDTHDLSSPRCPCPSPSPPPGTHIHTPEPPPISALLQRLRELDIEIFEDEDTPGGKDYSRIGSGDVVIFPAFGATVQEMQLFKERGVSMVDTTCPWVTKVWNSVDQHSRKAYTSVIHGKYSHEETIATASFADKYIIVRDLEEAQAVCDYIVKGGDAAAFSARFSKAVSEGFDPDTDLQRVGLANQVRQLLCAGCARAVHYSPRLFPRGSDQGATKGEGRRVCVWGGDVASVHTSHVYCHVEHVVNMRCHRPHVSLSVLLPTYSPTHPPTTMPHAAHVLRQQCSRVTPSKLARCLRRP